MGEDEARALEWLERLAAEPARLAELPDELRLRLRVAAGRISRPDRDAQRAVTRALRKSDARARRAEDERALASTRIRKLREERVFPTPPPLAEPSSGDEAPPRRVAERSCYVCKQAYRELHFHYDQLCASCGDFNFAKRGDSVPLPGRVALVTGARVKIGYHAAIKLLRAGAEVIVTTRFPRDAAERYAREPDYADWCGRLHVFGLDLRNTPAVERLCKHLEERFSRLDFILNNACQTVRRPAGFYRHLLEREEAPGLLGPGDALSADAAIFPAGQLDKDLQQVDLRAENSWRLRLHEVSTLELLEVQLVNAVAPYVLNARLKRLMLRTPERDKHIVNVSAMEGQFYRSFKTDKHPHTNMAKAALNMMTRTSAGDYARDGIHMNSVDTGWVTDEDPAPVAERKAEEQGRAFAPPLDVVDGAARIVAPIFEGLRSGQHVYGQFLKDYRPAPW